MRQLAEKPLAVFMMAALGNLRAVVERHCRTRLWSEIKDREAFLDEEGAKVRIIVAGGGFPLKPGFLNRLPNLGLIACAGSGYEGLDLPYARARGLELTYAPNVNHDDVADLAIGLLISTVRRLPQADAIVRSGEWSSPVPIPMSPSLRDLRFGVVGLGAIGRAIARRLEPFGGAISWWGPRPKPEAPWPLAESLMDLARDSGVLLLALRADESNRGIVGGDVIDALGPEGYLINVARGFAVDEAALVAALREGRLAGAGLDVFEREPTDAARWRDLANVALAPHMVAGPAAVFARRSDLSRRTFAATSPASRFSPRSPDRRLRACARSASA